MSVPSRPSEKDHLDWAAYAHRVTPLRGPDLAKLLADATAPSSRPSAKSPERRPPNSPPALSVGEQPSGVDASSWQRLRTGRTAPTRTLDLHGRTAQRAYHALHAFLHAARTDGVRCVEIVTGRGAGEAGGVLRRELPMWLNSPALRPLVLAASYPHPANPGAVRLLLRRAK